ncbi:hypothetical protein KXW38_004759 [Aspergillus fumigatus]|nr:hypothetical protein KXW38_004759 [Aspergillus fumigatus]
MAVYHNDCLKELLEPLGLEIRRDLVFMHHFPLLVCYAPSAVAETFSVICQDWCAAINSDDFDCERLIPLLGAVLNKESDDAIWAKVYAVAAESTPPPRPLPFLDQTPYLHTTSSFVNSSERRKHVDTVLKEELGTIYVGIPDFYDAYFGGVDDLDKASAAVLRRCKEGDRPLFSEGNGWRDWPDGAKEKEVLDWLSALIDVAREIATEEGFTTAPYRTVLAQPGQPLQGSTADRKLDIGLVRKTDVTSNTRYHWSHVLVLGELKSNPSADTASRTWRDLGRYAREVLTAQDTRRFALGFTLCGPNMQLWEFDRVGAIASSPFDINKNGLQFVSTMLDGRRFIEIIRDGHSERLILDRLMKRAPCIAGRATTCWIAHREGDKSHAPLVIKDPWQYPEREEEGKLLAEPTEKGVVNVARYYYHETVQVGGNLDDIRGNVRKGLDVTQATNYRPTRFQSSSVANAIVDTGRICRSTSRTGCKRSSSRAGATLPPSKRNCSSSPSIGEHGRALQNRVHRRVIIRDYGSPVYRAKSCISLLSALENCIKGYESLHTKVGFLQGDISTGNLILNDDEANPSWSAFLIDLDLAIKEQRERPSGARDESRIVPRFEKWNYVDWKS